MPVRLLLVLLASAAAASASLVLNGPWIGGVTSTSAVVTAKLSQPRLTTLEVGEDRDITRISGFAELQDLPENQPAIARYKLYGLKPNTRYYYRIRAGGMRDLAHVGTFRTFPVEGQPHSFQFAFSSGARTGSDAAVFAEIKYHEPRFFLHLGDLHHAATPTADREAYRQAYDATLLSSTQDELYRALPIDYAWHRTDYHAGSAAAAHAAFREYVPHYPLAAETPPATGEPAAAPSPLTHAFTVGRVRFLVLDTVTAREPGVTLLGAWQKAWLQRELLEAAAKYPLVFVASAAPWLADDPAQPDTWAAYAAERAELSDWLAASRIRGVCLLTGGAGMLAADDGSHNTYGSAGGARLPVLHAGPLDGPGQPLAANWSVKPVYPQPLEGQFALVDVLDQGRVIQVTFTGRNHHGHEKLRYVFQVPAP